jgi:Ca-activated chloride channel homolog
MFRFSSVGDYSYFLLLIVVLIGVYYFRYFFSKSNLELIYSNRLIKYYFGKLNPMAYGLKSFSCFVAGSFMIVLALFRPQYGGQKVELNAEGVEVVFVVDVSKSMAAEDVKPQRLKLAQIQLKKLIEILENNRMGIVAFAGQVGVISPLTQDIGALNLFIDSLDFNIFSEQGTNIGFALQEAKDLLERGQGDKKSNRTKVVVLITDGEDHSGVAEDAVKKLKDKDIKTFVIGVGTTGGGKIPIKDKYGQTTGYLKDGSGSEVVSKPNFSFLKGLSKIGGGGFYKLDFGAVANKALAKDFENLQKSKLESQSFEVKGEYYQIFLALGFVFLTLSFLFSMNRITQKMGALIDLEDL